MNIKNLLFILLGNLLFAFGVVAFVIPAGTLSGGTTGIALCIYRGFDVPVSVSVIVINIVTMIMGFVVLGREFFMTTILSSCLYPIFLAIMQFVLPSSGLVDEIILNIIFGGVLIGAGVGLILRFGGSSGGVDIPALILSKKTGISVSVFLYSFDVYILVLQAIYSQMEQVLYSIIMVFLTALVVNKVIVAGRDKVQVVIISDSLDGINDYIQQVLKRGSTYFYIKTGYGKNDTMALMSVMSRREALVLMRQVEVMDPFAFMSIINATEVKGIGFTLKKMQIKEKKLV